MTYKLYCPRPFCGRSDSGKHLNGGEPIYLVYFLLYVLCELCLEFLCELCEIFVPSVFSLSFNTKIQRSHKEHYKNASRKDHKRREEGMDAFKARTQNVELALKQALVPIGTACL